MEWEVEASWRKLTDPSGAIRFLAAEVNHHAKMFCHRRLGEGGLICVSSRVGISHLDVVALVSRHHLIPANSVGDGMHNGPLRGCCFESSLRFRFRESHDTGAPDVHVEFVVGDKNSRPDNFSRLRNSLNCPSTVRKIHRWLTVTCRAAPAAKQMGGGERYR